jgi:hypothetical protein
LVVWVVDKRVAARRRWWWDDNILRFRPWLIHDELVESAHEKVHDSTLVDLDVIREYHMVHKVPCLGGI